MRISIRIKLIFLILSLIILVMGTTGFIISHQMKKYFLEEIKLRGNTLVHNLATTAEEPLSRSPIDYISLGELLKGVVKQKGIINAFVVDKDNRIVMPPPEVNEKGEIIYDESRWRKVYTPLKKGEGFLAYTLQPQKGEEIYEVSSPIYFGKDRIGRAYLRMNLSSLKQATVKIQTIILLITVIGLFIGIFGVLPLTHLIVQPIKTLVRGALEIGRGNFRQRIKVRSKDEIGDLVIAFNKMAQGLLERELIKDAFKKYVSPQVAYEIFKDPNRYSLSLKGERRRVVVLFADIRGFLPLSERFKPEGVVELLNSYFTRLTKIIFEYDGTVDKYIGDCLMAVFGAPVSHPDDPERAIRVSLDIQSAIEELNKEREEEEKEKIGVGIGIHSGEAVVGNIGSPERLDYTVIGDCVNLASRIQKLAKPGEVVISEEVYQAIKEKFEVEPIPEVTVQGKTQPLRLYKVRHT